MSDDTTNADSTAEAPATPKRRQASVSTRRVIGVAWSGCRDAEINREIRQIQRELSIVGSAVSTRPEAKKPMPDVGKELVQRFDALVARFEAEPNVLRDWSIPGEFAENALFANVRYVTSGGVVQPTVLEYLNRLSDVLWLCARVIEARNGVDTCLRTAEHPGPPWSRW